MKRSSQVDDADFRKAFAAGDDRSLAQVIDRLYPSLTQKLRNHGATREEAEDIFYVAIEVLWEKGRAAGFEPGFRFYPFLQRVCMYKWFNLRRSNKNRADEVTPDEFALYSDAPDGLDQLVLVELRSVILQHLENMGNSCKEILLYWADGLTYEEISQKTGSKSVGATRKKKFKCLERLKKIIGDGLND